MDMSNIAQATVLVITAFALKVLGAVAVWLVARRVIAAVARVVVRSLKYPFDQTVAGYLGTAVAGSSGEAGFPAPEQNVFVRTGS